MSTPVTPDVLAQMLEVPVNSLRAQARKASKAYREVSFVSGGRSRTLQIPSPTLKDLQDKIHRTVLADLPLSSAVHSCAGRSVVTGARVHINHAFVSIRDFKNCFPSVRSELVSTALMRSGFTADAAGLATRLCTVGEGLPIGAPTSPILLNIVLRDFDEWAMKAAGAVGLTYTRYADDLTLSGATSPIAVFARLEREAMHYGLHFNKAKRRDWRPGQRPTITGIVIGSTLQPEPEFLENLIVALIDAAGGNWRLTPDQIQGAISWVHACNPKLARNLQVKLANAKKLRSRSVHPAPSPLANAETHLAV